MTPILTVSDSHSDPLIFDLDAEFHINGVRTAGTDISGDDKNWFLRRPFVSLVPPEARGAADEFFARLLAGQTTSTSRLFLQFPEQKPVPIDIFCRRTADTGSNIWEAVIWNRERYSRTERELMLLYAVSSRINQSTDELAFSEEVLFQIHNMMDVDASGLMHLQRGRLELTAARGLSNDSIALLKNLPDWQVDLYLPVDSVDPPALMPIGVTEQAHAVCQASGCQPWLVVPVRTPVQFYGVLGVARKADEPFTERERYMLMSLGRNLANAREKGRLFRRVKERNRNLARSRRELRDSLENLERAHRELQHLEEMKKSFVTLASHELQTPLTSIIGNAELLSRGKGGLSPAAQEHLSELISGVDDLRSSVEALLAANRVESGFFAPRFDRSTTQQIFTSLETEFRQMSTNKGIEIHRCKYGQCPDILLDVELMKQALRLQIDNAIRHTSANAEVFLCCHEVTQTEMLEEAERLKEFYPDIEQRIRRYQRYVLVAVEDNGDGVPESEKVRIFSPFYSANGLNQHHSARQGQAAGKGFGLGLSLAKRIIEAHNGMIWVEPREGGGSRFSQLLPLP